MKMSNMIQSPLRLLTVEMRATTATKSPTRSLYIIRDPPLILESSQRAKNWKLNTIRPVVKPVT